MKALILSVLFISSAAIAAGSPPEALPSLPQYPVHADSAEYHVPVASALEAFSNYTVREYEASLQNGVMKVSYALPITLTGADNHESFEGLVNASGTAEMKNAQGTMTCIVAEKMCSVKYEKLNLDLKNVAHLLLQQNLSAEEFSGRLLVARAFGGDMEGVIRFPDIQTK